MIVIMEESKGMHEQNRLTKRNLWTYSLGSIGRDLAGGLWSSYLLTFVLYTKSLTNGQFAVISLTIVAARIFDAMNDPVMGNILEVTRTKWGKFKPWIAIGMALSAVVFVISFSNTLQGQSYVILFVVMYFTYSIVFTMNDIAYWGMIPSLASCKDDRDLLTSRAVLFAGIGGALTGLIVPTFTAGDMTIGGSAVSAYRALSIIFSVFFIGMQVITLVGVKEKPLPPKGSATVDRVGVKTIISTMKNNDQLMWCMVIFLCYSVGNGLIGGGLGVNYIYFEFGYNGLLFTLFSALGAVAAGVVMIFFTPISKKYTRDQLMKVAAICAVGGYIMMLIIGLVVPSSSIYLKFALLMIGNLFAFGGQGIYYLIMMICIANTVEYNEWKFGTRAEGIIFSVRPLVTKFGWAIIQLMVMIIFLLTGVRDYTNEISDIENGVAQGLIDAAEKSDLVKGVLQSVPSSKSTALLVCMTIIPAILAIISYYLYKKKFIITEEKYDEILEDLKARKAD